jgi:outer membrane protein OmpA-like peptidoglycan-associated protein
MKKMSARILMAGLLCVVGSSYAQEEELATGPLYQGGYLAPMATYVVPGAKRLDDGWGGTLGWGYRNQGWALELVGFQVGLDSKEDASPRMAGGAVNGLLFPFSGAPNLYGIASVGGAELAEYPIPAAGIGNPAREEHFTLVRAGAGVGYLFPISFGNYEMAIRAEALYVAGFRDKDPSKIDDVDAPRHFNDGVFNLGLQLPLGLKAPPPPPVVPAVVAPVSICADGQDNDGDGLVDYPNDPGCTAADDLDETDPPQCSDGKDNDGDGQIDFPADKGCSAADDHDETDPCKTPEAGEKISLKGCGTGDVIVLRGVNFEFDKARLTPNAQSILDGVAAELKAYPEIQVELSGHTDALGSDAYNQRLSERRAASVKAYLVEAGIDGSRMTTVGHGESQPVADNQTEEGRELNRRTELKVTAGTAVVAPATAEATAADAPVEPAPADTAPVDAAPAEPTAIEAAPAEATP